MLKINEFFYSVQGEIDIGKPAIFIRTQGCNMEPKCTFCDSSYSWNEGKKMSNEQLFEAITPFLEKCNYIIFTGGEPTIQIKDIINFMKFMKEKKYDLEYGLESNGLLAPKELLRFNYISISPKKQNFNLNSLNNINFLNNLDLENKVRFKFVYENKKDLWFEKVIKQVGINKKYVYIMPEGMFRDKQISKMEEVVEYCKNKGYNFTPRLHTLIWDNRRKV